MRADWRLERFVSWFFGFCVLPITDSSRIRALLQLAGYTLMTNHVHHIPIPEFANSLAKGFRLLHQDFSRWQNIQQNVTGHLWQNRFFSCPLDEDHFWKALRYVELNPVRAGLVSDAWDWPWSSARARITGVDDSGLLNMEMWRSRFDGNSWKEFLKEGLVASERDHNRIAPELAVR